MARHRVEPWLTRRPTARSRGRSRPSRASTGSATRTAGSSTSARPRTCARGCRRTSRTSATCTRAPPRWSRTAASVEWTVVSTEVEALQLEYSWIKEFDPRFNVKYRDDKSYPWLAVTVGEEFPRVHGRCAAPSARAPATSAPTATPGRSARPSTCCCGSSRCARARNGVFKRAGQIGRPCLLGYIDKCSAPCVGRVTAEEHRADRRGLLRLHGRQHRPRSSSASSGRCTPPSERRTTSRPPGCATTSAPSTRRWRSRRSSSATAPTPTSSPSPRTRSRSPSRSSTSAAAGSAASAAGWPTRRARSTPRARRATSCSSVYGDGEDAATRSRARSSSRRCPPTPRPSSSWLGGCAAPGRDPRARSAATSAP